MLLRRLCVIVICVINDYHLTHRELKNMFYIIDKSVNPPQDKRFNTYPEVINCMGEICKRMYGQTKEERVNLLVECGNYADPNWVTFYRSMAEVVDNGVIRDGKRMRCDIANVEFFRDENYGN